MMVSFVNVVLATENCCVKIGIMYSANLLHGCCVAVSFTQFFHPPDINECSTNNGGCAHNCTNTQGSFTCSCRSGFQLASDGRDCNGKALLLAIHYLQFQVLS